VFSPTLAEQFHRDDMDVLQSGQALVNAERISVDAENRLRVMLTSKIPLRDSSGAVVGLVGISRDITERKQLEQQAVELAAERERARVLQRFISDISHDFRTPLSVINTSVYLATRSPDLQKREHYLKRIEAESAHIEHLLRDMLEMSILQQPNNAYYFENGDIYGLAREIASEYVPIAEARNRTVDCDIPAAPLVTLFDRTHIKRAVAELIENALNFTAEAGRVQVRAGVSGDDVALSVKDDGMGIAPEDQARIFEQFFRVDQARSTATGGTGLGLPIVKKIIEAHGGRIEVESEPGKGATFTILLPLTEPSAKETA
jgi:two-component system phosphate regulon sensor histidine kinase PhoR